MKTIEQRNQIIAALLPLLNEMQKCEGTRFIAELKQEITFADLMALSNTELQALQELVIKSKAAKDTLQKSKQYSSLNKKNYEITDESPEKIKPKIVC